MSFFPTWAKNILFLVVYIFSGAALVLIINGLVTGGELTPFNTAVEQALAPIRSAWLTNAMIVVTNVGSPVALTTLALILGIVLVLHRDTYDTLLYIVSLILAIISLTVLKNSFHIPRPTDGLVVVTGWSFPSAHATVATAFFLTTAYSFFDWSKHWFTRTGLVILCIAGVVLVSFSRVYLGVHYALDILAGVCLGLATVSFTALVFNIFLDEVAFLKKRPFKSL